MIRVEKIKSSVPSADGTAIIVAELIADTSSEVEDIGTACTNIVGLDSHYVLGFGSTCFTTTMEFGVLDSAGNWHFE